MRTAERRYDSAASGKKSVAVTSTEIYDPASGQWTTQRPSQVGLQFGTLLGGAVITENIFSLPGLGSMVVDGIFNRDFPAVQGAVLTIVIGVLLLNVIIDGMYRLIDKRIVS